MIGGLESVFVDLNDPQAVLLVGFAFDDEPDAVAVIVSPGPCSCLGRD